MVIGELMQGLTGFIANEAIFLYRMLNRVPPRYFVFGLSLLSALLLIAFFLQWTRIRDLRKQKKILNDLYTGLRPDRGLEKTAHDLLDTVRLLVKGEGYYFYLLDPKNRQYLLKAVRYSQEGEDTISPSHNGLLSNKKEKYPPPLSLPQEAQPASTTLLKEGEVSFLTVPVKGGKGQIRVSGVNRLPAKSRVLLDYLGGICQPAIDLLIALDSMVNKVDFGIVPGRAMRNAANATLDYEGALKMVMNLSLRMVGASGGCFLIEEGAKYRTLFFGKPGMVEEEQFQTDTCVHDLFVQLLGSDSIHAVAKGENNYDKLPAWITAEGVELVVLLNVAASCSRGIAVFWYNEMPDIDAHRFAGLQMMKKRMADLLDSNQKYKEMSASYGDMLRMMVETIENLQPHTMGYSELMARYSEIIAREMKMADQEIKDVVQAAYLSNIGLLGLSKELMFKPGKYSDAEYDTMKLHSEVGASIIEATIANPQVASYIRYHHERMDGNGYPAGLSGDDIPLGARIIAVVQTFLAKITGRRYREPLPFEQALKLIKSASGTQLDPALVNALIGWLRRKQSSAACKGRSLGACWEMRCATSGICSQCPAYMERERNCWEIEGTNCEAHGNNCPSCFVYTEFIYRIGFKEEKLQA